jgi:hypothetical protein
MALYRLKQAKSARNVGSNFESRGLKVRRRILAALMLTLVGGTAAILHLADGLCRAATTAIHRPDGFYKASCCWHRISKLDCDADLAGKVLPGIKHYFVPRFAIDGSLQVVLCGWKILRGSAGFQLLPDDAETSSTQAGTWAWEQSERFLGP